MLMSTVSGIQGKRILLLYWRAQTLGISSLLRISDLVPRFGLGVVWDHALGFSC